MNTKAAPTTVTVTTKITTTTATETGTPAQAAVAVAQNEPDTTATSQEDGIPTKQRRSGLAIVAAVLGLVVGLLAASLLVRGCTSTETARDGTVFSHTTAPRKLKLIDMSACRKDQLKLVDDTLVSAAECTVFVYEDGNK